MTQPSFAQAFLLMSNSISANNKALHHLCGCDNCCGCLHTNLAIRVKIPGLTGVTNSDCACSPFSSVSFTFMSCIVPGCISYEVPFPDFCWYCRQKKLKYTQCKNFIWTYTTVSFSYRNCSKIYCIQKKVKVILQICFRSGDDWISVHPTENLHFPAISSQSGVPQGLVPGPVPFITYLCPIGNIFHSFPQLHDTSQDDLMTSNSGSPLTKLNSSS